MTKIIDDVKNEEVKVEKFERSTRIEKSTVSRTIKSLYKNKDKLRFDLAIQRNEVWTLDQKSMLIHSILYGFPVPPVMVEDSNDDNIWFLDGKQRLTTIISFIGGEFALSKRTPKVYGHEIAKCKFSDLSEDMRDMIYDETIQMIKLKNMTDQERDEMFVRWNSGSSLSKIELTRAMHSGLIAQINRISDLEFFSSDIALTTQAKNRFVDQEIILQTIMLLDNGKDKLRGFGSSQIKGYVMNLKENGKTIKDEIVDLFEDVSKYLSESVSEFNMAERKKALKKIHVPMIFVTGLTAKKKEIIPKLFGEFIKSFLITTYDVNSNYGKSCQAGSSKRESVITRLDEMEKAFEKFEKELGNEKGDPIKSFENKLSKEIEKQVIENTEEIEQQEEKLQVEKKEVEVKNETKGNKAEEKETVSEGKVESKVSNVKNTKEEKKEEDKKKVVNS